VSLIHGLTVNVRDQHKAKMAKSHILPL